MGGRFGWGVPLAVQSVAVFFSPNPFYAWLVVLADDHASFVNLVDDHVSFVNLPDDHANFVIHAGGAWHNQSL